MYIRKSAKVFEILNDNSCNRKCGVFNIKKLIKIIIYLVTIIFLAIIYLYPVYAQTFKTDSAYLTNDKAIHSDQSSILYSDPENSSTNILGEPTGIWFTGRADDISKLKKVVDNAKQRIPIFVIYFIPTNPEKNLSAKVMDKDIQEYYDKNTAFAKAIGNRKSIIILEPDVLSLNADNFELLKMTKLMIKNTVEIYRIYSPNSKIYIDAGHSNWHNPDKMASILMNSGIEKADGFTTNISNFQPLPNEIKFASALSKRLNNKHFIVDTGRNGQLVTNDKILHGQLISSNNYTTGVKPSFKTNIDYLDAYLWIKPPLEKDK